MPPVRQVSLGRPFLWLALGWRDFTRVPLASALHGVLLALGGLAILAVSWGRFYLFAGAVSGFLLVAPILATGLYALSRALAAGRPATLRTAIEAWRPGARPLVWLGLGLMVVGTFWVGISALLLGLLVNAPITGVESFVRQVILSDTLFVFEFWMALGGMLAALVFAATAVSAPMLLDRDVDMATAVLTSLRAVGANPVAMALWAAMVMGIAVLGMATLFLGLVLAIPVLGHATWHAYADLVDASGLPPRN